MKNGKTLASFAILVGAIILAVGIIMGSLTESQLIDNFLIMTYHPYGGIGLALLITGGILAFIGVIGILLEYEKKANQKRLQIVEETKR